MRWMRSDAEIELSEEQRSELEQVARSRRTPQAVALRARIVLLTAGVLHRARSPRSLGPRSRRFASGGRGMWRMALRDCATNRARVDRGLWMTSAWRTC